MSSGSKKGTQIYFFFSKKIPGKQTPSRFPNRVPLERERERAREREREREREGGHFAYLPKIS